MHSYSKGGGASKQGQCAVTSGEAGEGGGVPGGRSTNSRGRNDDQDQYKQKHQRDWLARRQWKQQDGVLSRIDSDSRGGAEGA